MADTDAARVGDVKALADAIAAEIIPLRGLTVSATEPATYAVWFQVDPTTGALLDIRTP